MANKKTHKAQKDAPEGKTPPARRKAPKAEKKAQEKIEK